MNQTQKPSQKPSSVHTDKSQNFVLSLWGVRYQVKDVGRSADFYTQQLHSPGSIVYFNPVQRLAIVGDVLFAGSIGRTDLPGGDHQQLIESIKDKLLPLGDDVAIISGHGPTSTIGHERATNPFLQ